jgi:hypothetical protein
MSGTPRPCTIMSSATSTILPLFIGLTCIAACSPVEDGPQGDASDPPLAESSAPLSACPYGDGLYCGGDGVSGNRNTLYRCSGGYLYAAQVCSLGCQYMPPGYNDRCVPCPYGNGLYCGGDGVPGDPSTLYNCSYGTLSTAGVLARMPTDAHRRQRPMRAVPLRQWAVLRRQRRARRPEYALQLLERKPFGRRRMFQRLPADGGRNQ